MKRLYEPMLEHTAAFPPHTTLKDHKGEFV